MTEKLYRIDSPYFCAGLVLEGKVATEAAPIIHYMVGWNVYLIKGYLKRKGWKAIRVR